MAYLSASVSEEEIKLVLQRSDQNLQGSGSVVEGRSILLQTPVNVLTQFDPFQLPAANMKGSVIC